MVKKYKKRVSIVIDEPVKDILASERKKGWAHSHTVRKALMLMELVNGALERGEEIRIYKDDIHLNNIEETK